MNDNQYETMSIKETLASTSDTVKRIIDNKKEEIKEFEDDIETISQELRSEIGELEAEIKALSQDYSYDEIKDLKTEIETLSQDAYSEIEFLKNAIEDYEIDIKEMEETVSESDAIEVEIEEEDNDFIPTNPTSTVSNILSVLGTGASWVGKKTWSGVKKSSKYAWDHKEEWYEKGIENQQKKEAKIYKQRDHAYNLVQRQNKDTLLKNCRRLKEDVKNGKTLSLDDRFYFEAARDKLSLL